MKIVIAISHSFCANFIRGQAEFLKKRGCDVILVSADGPEVKEVAENEGAVLKVIPFSREVSVIDDIKGLYKVIKFLREEKPDIVNAGNPKTGFLFMLASLMFPRIPMIFTLRGLRSDTLTGFKKRIVLFTEWLSCSLAKKVIVISPSLKDHAINLGVLKEEKAVVLGKGSSNGVNTRKYKATPENTQKGREIRRDFNVSDEDIIFGHVGRLTKDKGIEELYLAFKECQTKNSNVKLFLTGPIENDNPISPSIMSELKSNPGVVMLGKQSDVTGVYSAYDVLVLFSYREGFGNVALEASSMEVPTIVSDIPGAKDTTEHMKSGLLVSPRSVSELANAMQYYIDNPDKGVEHGRYGAERARQFFSSEVIWNGQLELYKSLMKWT